MALGVNIQWGYAGLFNAGIMGFAALGGLAAVLISVDPVKAAWAAGGRGLLFGFSIGVLTTYIAIFAWKRLQQFRVKALLGNNFTFNHRLCCDAVFH